MTPEQREIVTHDVRVQISYFEDNLYRIRLGSKTPAGETRDQLDRVIAHHEKQIAERKAILAELEAA